MIDAGRREEAPGANKSPALGRAAPGRGSFARSGHPQQVAAAPSPGEAAGAQGAPGGGGRAREPRPPAPLGSAPTAGGIGAGGWGPGGGGAASLWAAPGRGLSAALRPPAPNADSKGGGRPWVPTRRSRGIARRGPSPPPPPTGVRGAAPGRRSAPARGVCAANGPVGRAFLWRSAQAVRPSYGVSGETAGMTAAGWARTMANSTAARVSGPSVLTLPIAPHPAPPSPFPLPSRLGRKVLARPVVSGRTPIGHPVWAITFPLGRECSGAPRVLSHGGVSLSNFAGCPCDGSRGFSACGGTPVP